MKSILSIVLTAVMLVSILTACGKANDKNVSASPAPISTETPTETPMAEGAIDKAEDKIDEAADKVEDKVENSIDQMEDDMTDERYPDNDLAAATDVPTTQEEQDTTANQRTVRTGQ